MSLTDFVGIVSATGTAKMTAIGDVKHRGAYDPVKDFYKPARDAIVKNHKNGGTAVVLAQQLKKVTDPKKKPHYAQIASGYKKWWGSNSLTWFSPTGGSHAAHGVEVTVNPDLGLDVNGTKHLIRVHFPKKLTKAQADLALQLMGQVLGPSSALLDARKSRLRGATASNPALVALIDAELLYIATLWPSV
jgi:hypothetical protein